MNNLDEIWAYDEPHPSGGNCHITMTKRQAIQLMIKSYGTKVFDNKLTNNDLFEQWVSLHWAYKEKEKDNAEVK